VELSAGLEFAREHSQGVLVTRRADGRPQLSNILYHVSGSHVSGSHVSGSQRSGELDPVVRISITDTRAKTKNLRREPFASLYVPGESFWSYVVLDATAELSPVAAAADDSTVEELVQLYRAIRGEDHPDWSEYRETMVTERRLVARLHPTHAYGVTQG
jgi:PPOX class probable F420-dependent enzyme